MSSYPYPSDDETYAYRDDVRYETDDDGQIIEDTSLPFCEECLHYHKGLCLCAECGRPMPCRTHA